MTAKRVHLSERYDHYGESTEEMNLGVAVSEGRIGEKGWLGNPNSVTDYGRERSIELFKRDLQWCLETSPILRAKFKCMKGEKIAANVPDHMDSHVDVIVKTINKM